MKNLFTALFVLIAASATGCATDTTDRPAPEPTMISAASEAEAMATVDELAPDDGDQPGISARGVACDYDKSNGICCFFMPDDEFVCVTW